MPCARSVKKPLVIKPLVFERLSAQPKAVRDECWDALLQLVETFGQPHIHSGIGIRKLGRFLFECRGNRDLRFLFLNLEDCLEVRFLGNHDEIRQELKSGRQV
jgi:hypothetical protein